MSAPTDLHVVGTFGASTTVTWTDTTTSESEWRVFLYDGTRTTDADMWGGTVVHVPAHAGAGAVSTTLRGLNPAAGYTVAVQPFSPIRHGYRSAPLFLPGFPAAPTLQVTRVSPNATWFRWVSHSDNATAFKLYRNDIHGAKKVVPGSLASGQASDEVVEIFLDPSTTYCWHVSALNATGETPSATVCATTAPPPPPPVPATKVTDVQASVSGRNITWSWQGPSDATSYKVTLADTDQWLGWATEELSATPGRRTTYTTSDLTPGHHYQLTIITNAADKAPSEPVYVPASISAQDNGPTPGVHEVDVYNCTFDGVRTVWLGTSGAWRRVGQVTGPVDGLCGPGITTPLQVTLPNGPVELVTTADDLSPGLGGDERFSQLFPGDDHGLTIPLTLSS
jgi:hypothetical protein